MTSINKMAGARSSCGVFQLKTKVLHFKIENTLVREKTQKNAQFNFCGQTKAFRYNIVFRGFQTFFFTAELLACFEPTGSDVLKKHHVHSVLVFKRFHGRF